MKITTNFNGKFKITDTVPTISQKSIMAVEKQIAKIAQDKNVDLYASTHIDKFRNKSIMFSVYGKKDGFNFLENGFADQNASPKTMLETAKKTINEFIQKYFKS